MTSVSSVSEKNQQRVPLLIIVISVLLALSLLIKPLFITSDKGDHYTYLAQSFARGDLAIDDIPQTYQDVVLWQGHRYLPLGPLPGVALIPLLSFLDLGRDKIMVWAGDLLTLLNVWLFYHVLGSAGVTGERRLWALLLFFGGTVYLSAIAMGTSWYFAHVLTTTLLLWAFYETLGKGRAWLVGLALGLAGMTRLTALFALPFVLYVFWMRRNDQGAQLADTPVRGADLSKPFAVTTLPPLLQGRFAPAIGLLFLGLAGPLALLFAYNYARFGSGLESGYSHAILTYPPLAEALSHGLFSLAHIPKNLFMLFLQGPLPYPSEGAAVLTPPYIQPSQWGMGIFFISPALLYIFRANLKDPLVRACLFGAVSILIPLITYYGIGWLQFGYRYALDFIPLLLIVAALSFPRPMTRVARILVLASVAINIWGTIFLLAWS